MGSRACGLFFLNNVFSSDNSCLSSSAVYRSTCVHYLAACVPCHFSHVQLCAALWTAACQPPLSKGFSKQGYWSGLPCLPSGSLPDPGIESVSHVYPALAVRFFTACATWEALCIILLDSFYHIVEQVQALAYFCF